MKDNIKRNRIGDISLYFLLTLFMLISFYKMNPNSEPLANDDGVYLYTTIDKWNEFYNDITTKKPKYIVEAEDFPSIKDGAPAGCEHIDDLFNRFMYYFENSYKEVDMTPIDGIRHIYLYSGTD